jgi:hypothetical protein
LAEFDLAKQLVHSCGGAAMPNDKTPGGDQIEYAEGWGVQDHLHFKSRAKMVVKRLLAQPAEVWSDWPLRPKVLGIYGEFGTGKTTFMRAMYHHLESRPQTDRPLLVWFSPHKYQALGVQVMSQEFLLAFEPAKAKAAFSQFRKKYVSLRMLAAILDAGSLVPSFGSVFAAAGRTIQRSIADQDKASSAAQSHQQDLCKMSIDLAKEGRYAVVFIDDLDRCLPDNCVALLEFLQHRLMLENVVYVISLSPNVVSRHLKQAYPGQGEDFGDRYLAKLFGPAITMPSYEEHVENMSRSLLSTANWCRMIGIDKPDGKIKDVLFKVIQELLLPPLISAFRDNPRDFHRYALGLRMGDSFYRVDTCQQLEVGQLRDEKKHGSRFVQSGLDYCSNSWKRALGRQTLSDEEMRISEQTYKLLLLAKALAIQLRWPACLRVFVKNESAYNDVLNFALQPNAIVFASSQEGQHARSILSESDYECVRSGTEDNDFLAFLKTDPVVPWAALTHITEQMLILQSVPILENVTDNRSIPGSTSTQPETRA